MSIQNSTTGEVLRSYNIDELREQANLMRGYDLVALCAAGSGHAGGTLSIMDIAAALYLRVANHDPKNPNWPDRDRIVWSTGRDGQEPSSNGINPAQGRVRGRPEIVPHPRADRTPVQKPD